jgi:PKHD-type hydroxylase
MWPSILTIEDFLTPADLDAVVDRVESATFIDGAVSAGSGNLEVKRNLEMAPDQSYVEVVKVIERSIRDSLELNYSVFPRAITRAIVSRYDEGMCYGTHIDSPIMGFLVQGQAYGPFGQNYVRSDFSMTVFLAEPDSYDGGDLCFDSPWGTQTYKLAAGSAVVYPTGLPHQVTPVTKGSRLAAVLWLQSMIRDHEQRRLVSEMNLLANRLRSLDPDSPETQLARDLAATALRINADI